MYAGELASLNGRRVRNLLLSPRCPATSCRVAFCDPDEVVLDEGRLLPELSVLRIILVSNSTVQDPWNSKPA